MPESTSANGTFYYSGSEVSAKIVYKIGIILTQLSNDDREFEEKVYKEYLAIKINNFFDFITLKKVLSDTVSVSKFLCFGGG